MKKVLVILSLALLLGSCDSIPFFNKKPKYHEDSTNSVGSSNSKSSKDDNDQISKSDEREYDYDETASKAEEAERNYYGETSGKNAEIEQWLTIVSKRRLTEDDIYGLPTEDLCLIRNLIFANHNYRFKESRFLHFFSKYEWYEPLYDNVSSELNRYETYNVNFLKSHEY